MPQVAVKPATLLPETYGVTDGKKMKSGYVSVMVPPAGTAFKGMNPRVAGTAAFSAFRSDGAMGKEKFTVRRYQKRRLQMQSYQMTFVR